MDFITYGIALPAMYLCNDDIEHAHDLAQAHEESMTANLCHAILHRREQDYWNSVSGVRI